MCQTLISSKYYILDLKTYSLYQHVEKYHQVAYRLLATSSHVPFKKEKEKKKKKFYSRIKLMNDSSFVIFSNHSLYEDK